MVLADSNGVNLFTQDPGTGEFVLVRSQLMIPVQPKTIYSINEGNSVRWYPAVSDFIKSVKQKEYSARYVGSMVADIHRTLLYGGIFMYPGDNKNKDGKLRLLYEVNPMSFIIEKAGGKATTGSQRVLDVLPTKPHQRCPVVLGCVRDVSLFEEAVAASSATSMESEPGSDACLKGPRRSPDVIDVESTRDVWHADFSEEWEDATLWAAYMFERQSETAARH